MCSTVLEFCLRLHSVLWELKVLMRKKVILIYIDVGEYITLFKLQSDSSFIMYTLYVSYLVNMNLDDFRNTTTPSRSTK